MTISYSFASKYTIASGKDFNARIKMYFENGYVWDTLLKEDDEWRRMIYEELQRYVDSDYNDLPGEEHQSEMSRAARLLDDDMIYEI